MLTVCGLKNCDACRKARKWLDTGNIAYRFVDLRDDGVALTIITTWIRELGLDTLVNRRSTTWRELPAREREMLTSANAAKFLVAYPTLIKRPLFDFNGKITVGFNGSTRAILAQ